MPSKNLIHDDFLLHSPFARKLYHGYAHNLPIIDYHNHLPPGEIANDRRFENISQAWLAGDHYKWRAMRTLGIREEFITGKASDQEKFFKWAEAVPYTARNPLFHWTQLELLRYFNIESPLNPDTARTIYENGSQQLRQPSHSTLGLLRMMQAEVVCTTDDPADHLEFHKKARKSIPDIRVLPAFRPDKAYTLVDPVQFKNYLEKLGESSGMEISTFAGLLQALGSRIEYFHEQGCRLADHGLEAMPSDRNSQFNTQKIFSKALNGEAPSPEEINCFIYEVLQFLCTKYHEKGWVQQFHLGALRNTNTRRLRELGKDTGFDSIGDFQQAKSLANFLNALEEKHSLTRTILYNLNPADNEVMATMAGNYSGEGVKGKIQWGSAWWFLDQKDGMEKQLNTLSNMGLLSCFVGMLTDSRSFLSFPRHEYFRRILCNLLGNDVENGELPQDEQWLGKLVQDICYYNAKAYFPF